MEAKFPKIFARFDSLKWRSIPAAKTGILNRFQHSNRGAWMSRAADGSLLERFRFSQGSLFGELRMMLVTCLEIDCCLSVAEISIVACSRRTDVASRKEMTVSTPMARCFTG
jgi:hypothetical protein